MRSTILRLRKWLARHAHVRILIIILLAILCVVEAETIVAGLRDMSHSRSPYFSQYHGGVVHETKITNPSEIEPWMTFQYINFVFKLPSDYLMHSLAIMDPHYPNVQLARYAHTNGLSIVTFLETVRQKVASYTPASR